MNIVYVSQVYPPDPGPSLRAHEQAKFMQNLGHDVTVLTTMSYYPSGRINSKYKNKLSVRERVDGVNILRIWSLPAPNRGLLRRVLSQISFAAGSFLTALRIKNPDLVIASTHIFAVEAAALLLASIKRCKSLVEFRDLLPESLSLTGVSQNGVKAVFLRRYFNFCLRRADLVAVPCATMIPRLLERGVSEGKIILLPHGSDKNRFARARPDTVRKRYGLNDRFVVVYAGSFSPQYDVKNLLRAAGLLAKTNREIVFMVIGGGHKDKSPARLKKDFPCGNVVLTGHLPPNDVVDCLAAADVCVNTVVSANTPDFCRGYPTTKICDYLMAGKPVIAVENVPVMGEYLERIEAGVGVRGGDPQALAGVVLDFFSDRDKLARYSDNAYRHAREHMDREKIVGEFDKVLREKTQPARR